MVQSKKAISTLSAEEIRRIKDACKQTDAIFRLEGFEPTEQKREIDAAVLAGRVTRSQVIEELRDYAVQHKTSKGFIESRTWRVSVEHQRQLMGD